MGYSPESPRDMSPDALSPFPDRPIRPLPKKPLRERLSPDVAQTIKYPPAPKTSTSLFYTNGVHSLREEGGANGVVESQHPAERERADEVERNYITRRRGDEGDSDEEVQGLQNQDRSKPLVDISNRSYRFVQSHKTDSKHPNPLPPASTASSADGYDSFENTNNKKKRKIPTPGDSTLTGVHLSSDLAGMGISGPDDLIDESSNGGGSYHSPGSGQGLSGPGRGRYGRIRNGRSPLRTLSDASSNWSNGRSAKQRQSQWPTGESTGIISESIASANAEKYPITPSRGQENVSVLLQQASKKSAPASAQFTFTCDSQVPGTVLWPGANPPAATHMNPPSRTVTHGTQTSPNFPANLNAPSVVAQSKQNAITPQSGTNPQKQQPAQAAPPKKTRRRTGKEYLIAARQRREQQKWKNDHHPIPKEDQWTCEFCEYEQIFGCPPVALIKQYEIKDRQARKQEAERRRLLEKAKMKGRKGKKGNKTAGKANLTAQDRQAHQTQRPASMNANQSQSQSTQSEEYYEDENDYDEDYARDDPPPSPTGPRAAQTTDSGQRVLNNPVPVA